MSKRAFAVAALFMLPFAMFAAERMVLGELYTSTTCPPCVAGNAALTQVLSQTEDYFAVVRFHAYWPSPGNDPFYAYNPLPNANRIAYYGVNGVPSLFVDGYPGSAQVTAINNKHDVPSPIEINLYRTFETVIAADQGEGMLIVELYNEQDENVSFRLLGALTESNVEYTGTNGDPVHHQVMLEMLPGHEGTDVTLTPEERRLLTFDFNIDDTIPFLNTQKQPTGETHISDAANCEIVFWAQNVSTKEVYQAGKTKVMGEEKISLSGITATDASGDGELGANEEAYVHVTVNNASQDTVKNVHLYLEIAYDKVTVEDGFAEIAEIAPGESQSVEGNELVLKTKSTYDGSEFNITCNAGSKDGTWISETKPLIIGIEETPSDSPFLNLDAPGIVHGECRLKLTYYKDSEIALSLFDASGRRTREWVSFVKAGSHEVSLDVSGLAPGVYFVKAAIGSQSEVVRVVVVH